MMENCACVYLWLQNVCAGDPSPLETNISPTKALLKMIFPFPRWDTLIPWRVILSQHFQMMFPFGKKTMGKKSQGLQLANGLTALCQVICTYLCPLALAGHFTRKQKWEDFFFLGGVGWVGWLCKRKKPWGNDGKWWWLALLMADLWFPPPCGRPWLL